ncbi:MAG: hypothetical protein R3Y18_00080 [Bacillota bacterium]
MKKKMCPYCGKEMQKDNAFNPPKYRWFCNCKHGVKYTFNIDTGRQNTLHIVGEELEELLAMKAEHAKLKAEAARTRWHSVEKEGLPEICDYPKKYMVTDGTGYLKECFWNNGMWNGYYEKGIIAWAELKEPYRGDYNEIHSYNSSKL